MSWDIESFREKIEIEHEFPGNYIFKFIVPKDKKDDILSILPKSDLSFKESSNGKYVSVTSNAKVENSQTVLEVYMEAYKIKGCIAL